MSSMDPPHSGISAEDASDSTWTYPTRFCRICREDVPATVTMYPPGLPLALQRPIVEYKNEDEYGRLIKPCKCKGGMRYIHELCLRRSRTENNRAGSMWKCHECGHRFNFQRLAVQRYLSSKYSSFVLTIVVMLFVMFILGFVMNPILNFVIDPEEAVVGHETIWRDSRRRRPVRANSATKDSGWLQHFGKGFISMGLISLVKVLSPWQLLNLRRAGISAGRTTSTGRERVVNLEFYLLVIMGVLWAFYIYYQWVQAIIQKSLQRLGNNIVDTQLPDDDEDIKPPLGWKPSSPEVAVEQQPTTENIAQPATADNVSAQSVDASSNETETSTRPIADDPNPPNGIQSQFLSQTPADCNSDHESVETHGVGRSAAIDNALRQGWTFADI